MEGELADMLIGSSVAGAIIVVFFVLGVLWASFRN